MIVTHIRMLRRCHMMAKVDKADNSVSMGTAEGDCKAEADKFLLVVCQVEQASEKRKFSSRSDSLHLCVQADKRIVCEPFHNSTKRSQAECAQKKEVNAVAVCDFCTDLWNLGGTCIKNHMDGLDLPNCPKSTSDAKNKAIGDAIKMINGNESADIKPMCRRPSEAEQNHCTKLAMSF